MSSPDTGATGSTYDAAGNLKTMTDARGKVTTYTYDALNRVTRIAYASGTATVFEYDGGTAGAPNAKGRLTKITDESGSTIYTYDAHGRVVNKRQIVLGGGISRQYNVAYSYGSSGNTTGKLISIKYSSNNLINFSYDAAGRISSLTLSPANGGSPIPLLKNIGYVPFGPANSWSWGNHGGTLVNNYRRTFDQDGRIVKVMFGRTLYRQVTYDAASRITATTHSGTDPVAPANYDQAYQYDGLDRLTGLVASNTSQSFQYDANGNRKQATFGGTSFPYTTDSASNRLKATAGPAPAKANTYDAAGNLLNDGTTAYTYSDRGRLASTKTGTAAAVSRLYNGLGQRVYKTGGRYFVYDEQGQLIGEYDSAGRPFAETVYLDGMPVVVLKPATSSGTATPATDVHYVFADHLNTPRAITRASDNKIAWRWDNADPFGMLPPNENPSGLGGFEYNLRFPGQYFDKETNLHYNYFRDYDPGTGRYVQSDPIGLDGGINTYAYVGGNPLSYGDPFGLLKLPNGPSGLPSDWTRDTSHRDPNGERWRHPSGDFLDWAPAQPGKPGWRGKDHWHHNNGDNHLVPGDIIPDPVVPPAPAVRCEGNCKQVWKTTKDGVTGALIMILVWLCFST